MNHAGADANSGFRILQTLFAHVGNLSVGAHACGAPHAPALLTGLSCGIMTCKVQMRPELQHVTCRLHMSSGTLLG